MLLNHERKPVWGWNGKDASLCPDCREPLVARRGELVVWHWAHHPSRHSRARGCLTHESQWHLRWKLAYYGIPGWDIEVPVMDGKYRIDAMNASSGSAREFIHTLSPTYAAKHRGLVRASFNVLWIWDGSEFVAERRRVVRGNPESGYGRFLKPKAFETDCEIRGLVHYEARLWRCWKSNVWYPMDGSKSRFLLDAFGSTQGALETVIERIEERRRALASSSMMNDGVGR